VPVLRLADIFQKLLFQRLLLEIQNQAYALQGQTNAGESLYLSSTARSLALSCYTSFSFLGTSSAQQRAPPHASIAITPTDKNLLQFAAILREQLSSSSC